MIVAMTTRQLPGAPTCRPVSFAERHRECSTVLRAGSYRRRLGAAALRWWLLLFIIGSLRTDALAIGSFSPSLFQFSTIVADDGRDGGGGWQQATAVLRFADTRHVIPTIWSCRITIGMPIRAVAYGKVSPNQAADWSAEMVTEASTVVMKRRESWIPTLYCIELVAETNRCFNERLPRLGAQAKR